MTTSILPSVSRRDLLKAGVGMTAFTLAGCEFSEQTQGDSAFPMGRALPFNHGWQFFNNETKTSSYDEIQNAAFAEVHLPHDWSLSDVPAEVSSNAIGPFYQESIGKAATGFTRGGEGWYRKVFKLPSLPQDSLVEISFEGVAVESEVWVNHRFVGRHTHAYTSFSYDISDVVIPNADNSIVVKVTNRGLNSRWYAGSGIYRDVSLTILPHSSHFVENGVHVWTEEITASEAHLQLNTEIAGNSKGLTLRTKVFDAHQQQVYSGDSSVDGHLITLERPQLWSPDQPNLYDIHCQLVSGDQVIDQIIIPFGVRIVAFDSKQGMTINGEHVFMRGGCVHHDNGLLGAVSYYDAEYRKISLLKARGYNAIRSSHNPSSRQLRAACDQLGMLMIDEAFDMWHAEKLPDDYAQYFTQDWQRDLTAMVRAARNSPCVVMWSIGNEVPERSTDIGVEWSWKLANHIKHIDTTRPVTAALHGTPGRPQKAGPGTARPGFENVIDPASSQFLDVVGYNYKLHEIEHDHSVYPDRVLYASETYAKDPLDYRILAEKAPYFIGEFLWTAMDYLGEAGIGHSYFLTPDKPYPFGERFPIVVSYCGDIDLIGHQQAQSFYRDVVWGISPLHLAVAAPLPENTTEYLPHWGWKTQQASWTWPGYDDQTMTLFVYTSGDQISVLLNGIEHHNQAVTFDHKMMATLEVPYQPGTLSVVSFKNGVEIARQQLITASEVAQIQVSIDKSIPTNDLYYVQIALEDASGNLCDKAIQSLDIDVIGSAVIAAFGTGNPNAVGSLQSHSAQCYQGRALLIVRRTDLKGAIDVVVHAAGLASKRITLA